MRFILSKKGWKGLLLRIFLGAFGLFIILLLLWLIPDFISPGSSPMPRVDRVLGNIRQEKIIAPASTPGSSEHPTSATKVTNRFPLLFDPEQLSSNLREKARKWNEAADSATSDMLALESRFTSLTAEEAQELLHTYYERYLDAFDDFRDAGGSRNKSETIRMQMDEFDRFFTLVNLEMADHYGLWFEAARCCMMMGYFNYNSEEQREAWWESEKYYLNKCGLNGYGLIAWRKSEPIIVRINHPFHKVERVLNVIEPVLP